MLYEQTRSLKLIQSALKEEIEKIKTTQKALEEANELLDHKVKDRTKELQQTNRELESSNAELQQFASVASHDLQEPLRKIVTFINILNEKVGSRFPEAETYMKKIVSSSIRMRNLIDDLLEYSKLSASSHFKSTDLNEIITEILADLELAILEKGANVHVGALPLVESIPGQMRQVFQNILSNALKFSRKDVIAEINIWGDVVESKSFEAPKSNSGDYLRINISDNGIGFKEQFLGKIFTIFQRLHTKADYDGTGIGLAIVRKIIEKHNGLITARSAEGEGSTFIIILPLKQNAVTLHSTLQS